MSAIIDDKRGIFNKLSVFTSLKEIELKPNNTFNSIATIDNIKDPLPFLLDLSTSLVGTDGLQDKFGLLFTQYIETYNVKVKDLFKKQFLSFNQNQDLPSDFVTKGINIPVSSLDDLNNLKTPKNDPIGELLYDDDKDNLITKLKNAINTAGNKVTFGNIEIIYNESSQSINIKPMANISIGNFIIGFIDNFSGINQKEFVADILDKIYGLKSKLQDKTIPELNNENIIDICIDKLLNGDDLILTDADVLNVNNESEKIIKGSNVIDCDCGFINNNLDINKLKKLADKLNGNRNPTEVGNLMNQLFVDSLDENTDESNITAIKDSFIKKIINEIKRRVLKDLLFSPEKKLIFELFNYFSNPLIDEYVDKDILEYIKANKNISECLVKEIASDIIEYILNLIKSEILKITEPALKKIIKEKFNNYIIILNSLIKR